MGNLINWTAAFANPISNPNSTTAPGVLNWMPGGPLVSDGAASTAAPSLTVCGGKLWCVHNDGDGNGNLWYSTYDFKSWQAETQVGGNWTNYTQSLYNNVDAWVLVLYSGNDGYIYALNDWQNPYRLKNDPMSDSGISQLVFLNGNHYFTFKGYQVNEIWIAYWSGNSLNQYPIDGNYTNSGPALCLFRGKLWLVYRGEDNVLYTITSSDGSNWSDPVGTGNSQKTDCQPSLWVVPGAQGNPDALLCVYGDANGYNNFWYTYNTSGDPSKWGAANAIPNVSRVSGTGMGLAVWSDIVFGAYMST